MKSRTTSTINGHSRPTQAIPTGQLFLAVFGALLLVPFCTAQSSDPNLQRPALSQANKTKVIYIEHFELDPNNFKQDKGGITGKGYLVPAPPKGALRRKRQDPATAANNLVQLMSESLIAELQKAGFTARRLAPGESRPTEGVLFRGVFTELSEGNQMRRALLGFGAGRAKMELYVTASDVSAAQTPLYEMSAQKSNGKLPGGLIVLNPYAGAASFVAKFAMTKNAPEKMVKKTASSIAAGLTKQMSSDPTTIVAMEKD